MMLRLRPLRAKDWDCFSFALVRKRCDHAHRAAERAVRSDLPGCWRMLRTGPTSPSLSWSSARGLRFC